MEKAMSIWKVLKEIGIVIMFLGAAYGAYMHTQGSNEQKVIYKEYKINETNNKILQELKEIKTEVKTIKEDYRQLKLKLFKANIIEDYGGFVRSNSIEEIEEIDKPKKPKKPRRRIAYDELIIGFRYDEFFDDFYIH